MSVPPHSLSCECINEENGTPENDVKYREPGAELIKN